MNKIKYRKDYQVPDFLIPTIDLEFVIEERRVLVNSIMQVERNGSATAELQLNGVDITLHSLTVDGEKCTDYRYDDSILTIDNLPDSFKLEISAEIDPYSNKSCEGLYSSGDILCTQCEAEGFRKIAFFPDRPDVMSRYSCKITADKEIFPYLLANGNLIAETDLDNGLHSATWEDPFPKPSYLFALVAGDLEEIRDHYTTKSGRNVELRIFVDHGHASQAEYAMDALKRSMKWDEDRFRLECDLDTYMIVAVDTFNMGAMENKGLNIFNSKYVLADNASATDRDFKGIEAVIGHEYFHNWTGNRITCRDWFQLTLKEGLTVFRDQEFSADMNSRAVKRIEDVTALRGGQFVEDSSPIAHPIRPESYLEIDNFYTSTIYSKGAEVIRMIHTLIGEETFQKGIDLYFARFDGQAITCDDFVNVMGEVADRDFSQFKLWYSQAGTPTLNVESSYCLESRVLTLTVEQHSRFKDNLPVLLPLSIGIINPNTGNELQSSILEVTKEREVFTFENIAEKPVLSLLRDFSAPVVLNYDYSEEELIFLLKSDKNLFCRYEAGQRLAMMHLVQLVELIQSNEAVNLPTSVLTAFGSIFLDSSMDNSIKTKMLTLPSLAQICQKTKIVDFMAAFQAREFFRKSLTLYSEMDIISSYEVLRFTEEPTAADREFKNCCLSYLLTLEKQYGNVAASQFDQQSNMTEIFGALQALCGEGVCNCSSSNVREQKLAEFRATWDENPLVLDKWFSLLATMPYGDTLARVKQAEKDSAFDIKVPNRVYALQRMFCANLHHFHKADGSGYQYIADKIIEIDKFNPNVAATLANSFRLYNSLPEKQQQLMKTELDKILLEELSPAVYEIISKTVNNGGEK